MPPKSATPKPKSAKEPKIKKPTVAQLIEENSKLLTELDEAKRESSAGSQKWVKVGKELLDGVGVEWRRMNSISCDPAQITEEIWLEIVHQLVVTRKAYEVEFTLQII